MYCSNCGARQEDNAAECTNCGAALAGASGGEQRERQPDIAPGGQQPPPPQPYPQQPYYGMPPPVHEQGGNTWLVPNIIAAVLSMCCCQLGLITSIIGIIYAAMVDGKRRMGDHAGAQKNISLARVMFFVSLGLLVLGIVLWGVYIAFSVYTYGTVNIYDFYDMLEP